MFFFILFLEKNRSFSTGTVVIYNKLPQAARALATALLLAFVDISLA